MLSILQHRGLHTWALVLMLAGCATEAPHPSPGRPVAHPMLAFPGIYRESYDRTFDEVYAQAYEQAMEETLRRQRALPASQVWIQLEEEARGEPEGYGIYTYVLAGVEAEDADASWRYQSLISSIAGSTATLGSVPHGLPRGDMNLFVVPVENMQAYWHKARSRQLAALLARYEQDISGKGPTLVSVYVPFSGTYTEELRFVYADLSGLPPTEMTTVVGIYRERLRDAPFTGFERLEAWQAHLQEALRTVGVPVALGTAPAVEAMATFQ